MIEYFESTIGDNIPVTVSGTVQAPERNVGYCGDFEIDKVWITSDAGEHDIYPIISKLEKQLLRDAGYKKLYYKE